MVTRSEFQLISTVRRLGLLLPLAATSFLACSVDGRADILQAGPLDVQFFPVSEVFTPSGHMGDGKTAGFLNMSVNEDCKARPLRRQVDGSGANFGSCYNFNYEPGPINWAGAYWLYPSNNWGAEQGRLFRPWVVNNQGVFQRYNTIQFDAAVNQNSFELTVGSQDSQRNQYRLDATVRLAGATNADVVTRLYFGAPDLRIYLRAEEGPQTLIVGEGWQVEQRDAAGNWLPVANAQLLSQNVQFELRYGVESQANLDFQVGTEVIQFPLQTPPVVIDFFAGSIRDDRLVGLLCSDDGQACQHQDSITTPELDRRQQVTRQWQTFNLDLTLRPPCVANSQGVQPVRERDAAGNRTGRIICPEGTVTPDGVIATCGQSANGAVTDDGSVLCCSTGAPVRLAPTDPLTCFGDSRPGAWIPSEEILEPLIGAFGWATNHQTFQRAEEAALRAMGLEPVVPDEGGVASVDPALLPDTEVFIDNVVWQFIATP